jgi:ABC-type spermidine/putrescine transport system permease subunit I
MFRLERYSPMWLLFPAALLVVMAFGIPMLQIVAWSVYDNGFTGMHFQAALGDDVYRVILFRTITLSLEVAVVCVVIAYPIAYYLTFTTGTRQRFYLFLITFPLWVSVLIRTYTWIVVLGREGLVNNVLLMFGIIGQPVQLIFNRGAVFLAMVQVLLPPVVLLLFGVMVRINTSLIQAARLLGASPFVAFRMIFLPLSMRGVVAAMILTFVLSLGFYVTPALVGGPRDLMISNIIAAQINQTLNWGFGSALGIVLLMAGFAIVGLIVLTLGRVAALAEEGEMQP